MMPEQPGHSHPPTIPARARSRPIWRLFRLAPELSEPTLRDSAARVDASGVLQREAPLRVRADPRREPEPIHLEVRVFLHGLQEDIIFGRFPRLALLGSGMATQAVDGCIVLQCRWGARLSSCPAIAAAVAFGGKRQKVSRQPWVFPSRIRQPIVRGLQRHHRSSYLPVILGARTRASAVEGSVAPETIPSRFSCMHLETLVRRWCQAVEAITCSPRSLVWGTVSSASRHNAHSDAHSDAHNLVHNA
jgi:hypothetical protein